MTADQPYSGRSVDYGAFRAVPVMIEEQVDRTPDRPAVSYDGRTLSYRALDGLANGLAASLARHGLRKGDTVPILLVNSLELPVAYLALMKLGVAFVPLDPSWPADRLSGTIEVLSPKVVICAAPESVPFSHRRLAVTVSMNRIPTTATRPAVALRPGDAVYGFFTSGTTGTPKCAVNLHAGLANRFGFMSRYFQASGDEVVLQNSRHTFDSSIWQLFWPLTGGGHVVLPVQREFLDLNQTIDTIAAYKVTASDFVSSIFNALVAIVETDRAALAKLSSLRWLIVGSEPINPRAVRRLTTLLPGLRIVNGYGPTETSIGMAFHTISDADGEMIPLGRPIDNCYAVILDDGLDPVAPGTVGEIAVGGACLGGGYFAAATATASAFAPNPFRDWIPGQRLYLTGDLGWLDAEGRLFFSGRKDFQVKIGGVRIELGEIKVVAEGCPGVQQAEVLVAEQGGSKSLALFAVCTGKVTESGLRGYLRDALPRANRPRHVFLLSSMPLSDNGKADRNELERILQRKLAADAAELVEGPAPSDLGGRVLWAMRAALQSPALGPDEHFFDSGGDSLKALTAIDAIRAEFDLPQLCAQDIFDQPTATRLTLLIEAYLADDTGVETETELMERDAATAPQHRIRAADRAAEPRTVLVTGATGFVGRRVVHEILRGTGLRVACLARAGDNDRAKDRVVAALSEHGLWEPGFAGRVDGYAGDLSLPGLGLPAQDWDRLAGAADLVLNCAALVNFLFDYRAHRRTNVLGTVELLRLAAHRPVPLHHVSTVAALQSAAAEHADGLPEDCDVTRIAAPPGGYNSSKWVAERFLAQARRRGATVTVLRLGEVLPSADNGRPNPVALTHLLLSAIVRLGICPDAQIKSDYTPVDYAAKRIVSAVLDKDVWGSTLNILHPQSVSFGGLLDSTQNPPVRLSCRDFLIRLRAAADQSGERELVTLSALLPDPDTAAERELRRSIDELLTDNPALYRKDACRTAERRWGLTDEPLHESISAYHTYLTGRYAVTDLEYGLKAGQSTTG